MFINVINKKKKLKKCLNQTMWIENFLNYKLNWYGFGLVDVVNYKLSSYHNYFIKLGSHKAYNT